MTIITKTIGRLPVNLGDYDSTRSYGKKNRCNLYGCEWESRHDNNTSAPAIWDGGDNITPNVTDWILISGSYETWLVGQDRSADAPFSDMGRVVLKKNIQDIGGIDKNILTQDVFYKGEPGSRIPNTNTVFVLSSDFEIGSKRTIQVTVSSGNVSHIESPDYVANVNIKDLLIAEREALIEGGATQEEIDAINERIANQQTRIDNTPQYYFYATVTIPAHKVLIAKCPGCIFLNSTLDTIIGKDTLFGSETDTDTTAYIAYLYSGTYDFVEDSFISIPANCSLLFDGGTINNGTIKGNHTNIIANANDEIFKEGVTIKGVWDIPEIYDGWFKYDYIDNTANNQVIHNILSLTHDGFNSHVNIIKNRTYLVELPEIPLILKGGNDVSCRQYNSSVSREVDYRCACWGYGARLEATIIFNLSSNTRYTINSTIKMLPTGDDYYKLFYAYKKENIVIDGYGKIIGDNGGIQNTHNYSKYYNVGTATYFGEQGFILRIYASKNIRIENVTLSGSFGDNLYITGDNKDLDTGVYYEEGDTQNIIPSKDVTLSNVKVLYARRNGVAISCTNAIIENCYFEGSGISTIKGTAPKAAIDFECDEGTPSLHSGNGAAILCNRNVTMTSCVFKGNEYDLSSTANRAYGENTIETYIKNCSFTSPLRLNKTAGLQFENCYIPLISSATESLTNFTHCEDILFIKCIFEDGNIRMPAYSVDGINVSNEVKYIDCIFNNDFKIEGHYHTHVRLGEIGFISFKPQPANSDYILTLRINFIGNYLVDNESKIGIGCVEYTFAGYASSTTMIKCKTLYVRGSAFEDSKDDNEFLPKIASKIIDERYYMFISNTYFTTYHIGIDYVFNCCKSETGSSETDFSKIDFDPIVGTFIETEEVNRNNIIYRNIINNIFPGNYKTSASLNPASKSPLFYNDRLLFPVAEGFIDVFGEPSNIKRSGTTANRPTPNNVGFIYLDTTLGKPIWWNGTNWIDATGATV